MDLRTVSMTWKNLPPLVYNRPDRSNRSKWIKCSSSKKNVTGMIKPPRSVRVRDLSVGSITALIISEKQSVA